MLRTVASYIRREVWPRRREIIWSTELLLALAVGAFIGWQAPHLAASTKLGDLLTIILAYAAVAFGFCVAGLTVALTIPDAEFTRDLATRKPPGFQFKRVKREPNAYSDLLFVFSWTAVAHWAVILVGLAALFTRGFDRILAHGDVATRTTDGILAFVVSYAILQFLITVITLSQVGNVYVARLRERDAEKQKD
jgi:hypothetical protein